MAHSHFVDFSGLTTNLTTWVMGTFGSKAVRLYTTTPLLSKVFFLFFLLLLDLKPHESATLCKGENGKVLPV
jgi:hypothetical protein